jgi:hypothetical protein
MMMVAIANRSLAKKRKNIGAGEREGEGTERHNEDISAKRSLTVVIASNISRNTSSGTGLLKSTPATSAANVGASGVTVIYLYFCSVA